MTRKLNIVVVSDSTGDTATRVSIAALLQHDITKHDVRRYSFSMVKNKDGLRRILNQEYPKGKTIIFYTLKSSELRKCLKKEALSRNMVLLDVMEPAINAFGEFLKPGRNLYPKDRPSIIYNDGTFDLADSIRYTIDHDDGMRPETIENADVVIFGLSRTGKTPTSVYLSTKNYRVANIPVILDCPIDRHLIELKTMKVGFMIDHERLALIRKTRTMKQHLDPSYYDMNTILDELEFCRRQFRRIHPLFEIDVTNRSIEETSEWIIQKMM